MRFSLLTKWAQVAVVIVKHKNILNAVCRLREIFSIVRSYFEIHQNSIITISASFFSKWSIIIVWVTLPFKEVILLFVPSNKPCFHFQFTGNSKTQEEFNEVKIYFFARIDMWEFSARKYMVPFVDGKIIYGRTTLLFSLWSNSPSFKKPTLDYITIEHCDY